VADPVSWYVIERGWQVVDGDGSELGKVEDVLGDPNRDIFDGLSVSTGLLSKPRYVPAELVDEILEGRVKLKTSSEHFERLDEYDEPPPDAPSPTG
jgi:ribosomal 30S subunit maturation factor RimM